MNELVEFLRARLDEDELAARTALDFEYEIPQDAPWRVAQRHVENGAFTTWDGHIARHDPARVLAEVEAKRRIIDTHEVMHDGFSDYDSVNPCSMLRALVLPYADHPDYREEWKP